jgi:hypothetical protein
MTKPQFPYIGNQVIVTSDRLLFHSKKDGIFLFGKTTIGLSSPGTINFDSKEKVLIDSPKIELGHKAEELGEQAVLGNTLVSILSELNEGLALLANVLEKVDGTTKPAIAMSFAMLSEVGDNLVTATSNFKNRLDNILSDTTYTT